MGDQTRRDWVFTIGGAAIALSLPRSIFGDTSVPIPPGVYLASTDHLGHALMTSERYHPIPPGCPTEYVRPRTGPYEPVFFSETEFPVIVRLIELMLGEDVANSELVIQEVAEWFDLFVSSAEGIREAEQHLNPLYRALAAAYYGRSQENRAAAQNPATTCREGLEWILHGGDTKRFLMLSADQQLSILRSISDSAVPKPPESAGTRFFALLKAQTIRGFYTSRVGLTELDYRGNAFYARSPGCNSK